MDDHWHQIALLHAERDDVQLLEQLLLDEPFEVVPAKDVCALADQQFEAQMNAGPAAAAYGVVVCAHDAEESLPSYTPAWRVTDELEQLTGRYKRVIVLADSMDEETVCTYLGAGAHHVIPRADSPKLMQARILAGLREHREPIKNEWHVGPYHFDLSRRAVMMDGRSLGLSPREFEFAQFLFEHRGRVIPISELLQSVWSLPAGEDSRRIDTAACRLRKKMMLSPKGEWQLRRLRRDGYQLIRVGDTS